MDKNRDKKKQDNRVQPEDSCENDDDDELTRLAMEELSKGATRAKERSHTMGVLGWKNSPIPSANKIYLKNTIIGALQSNVRIDSQTAVAGSSSRTTDDKKYERKRPRDRSGDDRSSKKWRTERRDDKKITDRERPGGDVYSESKDRKHKKSF